MTYSESLSAPLSIHEACKLPKSLDCKAQVSFTLTRPGRTVHLLSICWPAWPLVGVG